MSATRTPLSDNLIAYGPNANCTLALCPINDTVLRYQPSYVASGIFIAIFSIALSLHLWRGIRWREWAFLYCMTLGCIDEIIGYIGRIMLHKNPFSFAGFLIQIICITTGPVYFCAAIYVLIARLTPILGEKYLFVRPKFYYIILIPCDVVSLALQAAGGAMSSNSSGSDKSGVNISLAGLSFQVITLVAFVAVCASFFIKYARDPNRVPLPAGFTVFASALTLAVVAIFIRCAYRIDELKQGYSGPEIADEGKFIGLESTMIAIAVLALVVCHPGPMFRAKQRLAAARQQSGDAETQMSESKI